MNDENINDLIEEFGQPTYPKEVDPEYLESYRGKLPDELLEYWKQFGFSGFKDGLFWITDPAEYEGVLNEWIKNTELADLDTFHVIARSGFGELFLWGTKTGYQYKIDCPHGWIFKGRNVENVIKEGKEDFKIQTFFATTDAYSLDLEYKNEKPFFEDAVKNLGHLNRMKCLHLSLHLFLEETYLWKP